MALTWVSPTDDIGSQDGNLIYNFTASGTISAGQAVKPTSTMKVIVDKVANDTGCIGVAAYDVTDGETLGVWGLGNIVRCKSSGSITVGQAVAVNSLAGHVGVPQATVATNAKLGVALETVATDTMVKVLLV
jgi:hypothetical protein